MRNPKLCLLIIITLLNISCIFRSDPMLKVVDEDNGDTILHKLAREGKRKEVLKHPKCGEIKNKDGDTPLHLLAYQEDESILTIKESYIVKNNQNKTPYDIYKEVKEERESKKGFIKLLKDTVKSILPFLFHL